MPSYDYNALVEEIQRCRRTIYYETHTTSCGGDNDDSTEKKVEEEEREWQQQQQGEELDEEQGRLERFQKVLDLFQELSGHCPMTPLLWMQYAYDTLQLLQELVSSSMEEDDSLSAYETASQIVQLGLAEFPGSAILHLYHVDLLWNIVTRMEKESQQQHQQQQSHYQNLYRNALTTAIQQVGQGSHRTEETIVTRLSNLYIDHTLERKMSTTTTNPSTNDPPEQVAMKLFIRHIMVNPCSDSSGSTEDLVDGYLDLCRLRHCRPSTTKEVYRKVEHGRRYESKYYSWMQRYEDDIRTAMDQEGMLGCYGFVFERISTDPFQTIPWKDILVAGTITTTPPNPPTPSFTYYNGYGGPRTAQAFIDYAQACSRYKVRSNGNNRYNHDDDDEHDDCFDMEYNPDEKAQHDIPALTLSIYERGVSECPTVETLWLSYLRQLQYLIHHGNHQPSKSKTTTNDETDDDDDDDDKNNNNNNNNNNNIGQDQLTRHLPLAKSVIDRAVRNCPYSVALVQQRLQILLQLANTGLATFDPEDLFRTTIMEETVPAQFITRPQDITEIFLTMTQIIRRRILFLLQQSSIEPTSSSSSTTTKTSTNNKKKKKNQDVPTPQAYDDPEGIHTPTTFHAVQPDTAQELDDVCTDLQDIYDEMDQYFLTEHPKHKDGRARLWKDRAFTATHLLNPLLQCLMDNAAAAADSNNAAADDTTMATAATTTTTATIRHSQECMQYQETTKQYDKATKICLPAHPSTFQEYINAILTTFPSSVMPYHVLNKLRQVRYVYQKALKSVGRPKSQDPTQQQQQQQQLDYETSLQCLCRDYLHFETYFGSEKSYAEASKHIQKKLHKAFNNNNDNHNQFVQQPQDTDAQGKMDVVSLDRKRKTGGDDDTTNEEENMNDGSAPPSKKQKSVDDVDDATIKPTNLAIKPTVVHKVHVGNLEYPAHPFTIKVSFLSPQTQDMDLVDIFRPKCGPIVHAKIMRDKHHSPTERGKSKGWGLVQFEDRESVEKAILLSDVIGIHGKSVRIERSHLPAVSLVPPGMHRINPKGQGKSTKQNQRRKEIQQQQEQQQQDESKPRVPSKESKTAAQTVDASTTTKTISSDANPLMFRPRGVVSKKTVRPKPKVALAIKDGHGQKGSNR
ncbi:RNA recognition motif containing protein [Nitzschia inconspicua]|uniref:RNA recognition motif containing protein n=1 Tax=Nitzschia inconspicua TaxID=303405 RepID=A0A9K3M3X5_9STRA|nr:RNA recognition motif containing protein [Nitzschia inconspicua]